MGSRNKTVRTVLRWTHLLVGWLIGVFVYTPMREDEAFVLLMQVVFVPAVVLTGVWMWQQARIRRLYRRLRQGWRRGAANESAGSDLLRPAAQAAVQTSQACLCDVLYAAGTGQTHEEFRLPTPGGKREET